MVLNILEIVYGSPPLIYNMDSRIPLCRMDPTGDIGRGWRTTTVFLHLISGSALSWCLARRTFFRFRKRQEHPAARALSTHDTDISSYSGVGRSSVQCLKRDVFNQIRLLPFFTYLPVTTCARLSVFLALSTSFLFVICSAILVLGVGLDAQSLDNTLDISIPQPPAIPGPSCRAIIYICILCYGLTKVWIYLFLIERVYLVMSAGTTPPRLSTRTYRIASLGLVLYILILILLFLGHVSEQSTNNGIPSQQYVQLCVIGLRLYGLIPLLVYDILVTISLTVMFVIPIAQSDGQVHSARRKPSVLKLLRRKARRRTHQITLSTNRRANDLSPQPNYVELGDHRSEVGECVLTDDQSTVSDFELEDIQPASLRRLALRSLIACFVGLTTSVLNLSILVANDGREEGTTCIRWCLADVVINAVVICAVMQGRDGWWSDDDENMPPTETLPLGVWGSNDKGTHGASIPGRPNEVSGEGRTGMSPPLCGESVTVPSPAAQRVGPLRPASPLPTCLIPSPIARVAPTNSQYRSSFSTSSRVLATG